MFSRDFDIEKEITNKLVEWKGNGNEIFDFRLPDKIELILNPRKDGDDGIATGRCYVRQNKIYICYCNDMAENLHVLLHEMCHLNRNAHHHDKVYNRSFAYAGEKITGTKFDPSKPCSKLDIDIASAFGGTARKGYGDRRDDFKKEMEHKHKQYARFFLKPGDTVEYQYKISNGYQTWDTYGIGTITDINVETARCHIKDNTTGEVVSRKVNKIFKISKVIVERS